MDGLYPMKRPSHEAGRRGRGELVISNTDERCDKVENELPSRSNAFPDERLGCILCCGGLSFCVPESQASEPKAADSDRSHVESKRFHP